MKTTKDDEQTFYICGQCKTKIYYLKSDSPPVPCPECTWNHKDRDVYDVPSTIKLDLSKY